MRVKTFYRVLRFLSTVVLFFFIWTFGPVWQAVAFAATSPKAGVKAQTIGKPEAGKQKAEERFEGVLAEMREKVARAGEKHAKGEDDSTEREALRAGRASIDQISEELRAEFSSTEKRLKAAGLPKTILARHTDFVAHFERNVKELHDNLDGIESAKTKAGRGAKIEKARLHLEKTRPPRHYTPLNPDQLPNSNRKAAKTREPRTREQFEKDFPQQKPQGKRKIAYSRLLPDLLVSRVEHKPILLAFNETASDVPFSLSVNPQVAFFDSFPVLLAQQTEDLPNAADFAESLPEIQLNTLELRQLAADLEYNPTKIFSFVRNYIDFVPTYGSIQTAQQTLLTGRGNAFAQSALLITLLRISGIAAKFEYGTIILPIEDIKNWTGVTDASAALGILTNGGIPCTGLVVGSQIAYVRMEHIWTRAWIDYIPSRGAVHKQGDTWIAMDPSYKSYTYTSGVDFKTAVPFDTQSFLNEIDNTASKNDAEGWVTGVNTALAQSRVDAYVSQVNDYISANYPNAVEDRIVSSRQITKKEYPFLPLSLPYTVKVKGWESADLPSNVRHTVSFSVAKDVADTTSLSYSISLPEIAGKRITLSYTPATDADRAALRSLLPAPHADGTPLQINELPSSLPAYLINVKPELRIAGTVVATGALITLGTSEQLTVTLVTPLIGPEIVNKEVVAGEYYAMALDTGPLPEDAMEEKILSHNDLAEQVQTKTVYPAKDELYGEFLHTIAVGYFEQLNAFDSLYSRMMGIVSHRIPSFGFAQAKVQVDYFFGLPKSVSPKGVLLDMNHIMKIAASKDGDQQKISDFQFVSGLYSSGLEHSVLEQIFSTTDAPTEGISTVKILSVANSQNIPIYTITAANLSTVLPRLQTGINDVIQNAVNAGKEVITPERNVTINDWSGTGYIVYDPTTGGGAFMISSGTNGAYIAAIGAYQVACGEIIYDDDPWTGMEIMQAGINQIILADHIWELVLKETGKIVADLAMTFMPWGKVFQGVGFAFGCITSNIVKNGIAGRAFEKIALQTLKLTKNTTKYQTSLGKTIPDAVIKDAIENPMVLWEVKSSPYVCNTGNLPKLIELAKTRGIPLNLVVKESAKLSGPLEDAISGISGNIIRI